MVEPQVVAECVGRRVSPGTSLLRTEEALPLVVSATVVAPLLQLVLALLIRDSGGCLPLGMMLVAV